jgi:hypothetical protein
MPIEDQKGCMYCCFAITGHVRVPRTVVFRLLMDEDAVLSGVSHN